MLLILILCSFSFVGAEGDGITGCTARSSDIFCPSETICRNSGTHLSGDKCICPGELVGKNCNHSLYVSFDTMENLTLMQGSKQQNFNALVLGPINSAVSVNRAQYQWIDLGFHPEACLTQRYMCGAAGGAFSFWLRLIECPSDPYLGGIITTRPISPRHQGLFLATGFQLFCRSLESIRYILFLPNGYNFGDGQIRHSESHWFHIVFNFIGPNDGQGFRVCHDGKLVANITSVYKIQRFKHPSMDRRIVIGRFYTNSSQKYTSLQMDELMFFNRPLTEGEIRMMNPLAV